MTAPATPTGVLDLGKPIRWKSDHTPVIVLWSDDNDTFAEWQPPDDEPVRQHMRTEWFSERVENISPEPVGPEEYWLIITPKGNVAWSGCHEGGVTSGETSVRYIRADLAARKVKPLNKCEIGAFRAAYSDASMMSRFRDAMAARGIEVGE